MKIGGIHHSDGASVDVAMVSSFNASSPSVGYVYIHVDSLSLVSRAEGGEVVEGGIVHSLVSTNTSQQIASLNFVSRASYRGGICCHVLCEHLENHPINSV